jgi:hypothetical protein
MGDQRISNPPSDGFYIDAKSVYDVELNIIIKHGSKTTCLPDAVCITILIVSCYMRLKDRPRTGSGFKVQGFFRRKKNFEE